MGQQFWKVPCHELPLDAVKRVEIFHTLRRIIPVEGWPSSFWDFADNRLSLEEGDAQVFVELFLSLKPGVPSRCHMAPWGVAFYSSEGLISTVTFCFRCSNAYVYSATGKTLRAFDRNECKTKELLNMFKKNLPL